MAKEKVIEIKPIEPKTIVVSIEGDSDLILNQMNAYNRRQLTDKQKNKAKSLDPIDPWECVISSIHWRDGEPTEYSQEALEKALKDNAPCITGFGLKKSFGQAVVRNEIDTYATKFDVSLNILGVGDNLVPIKFVEHHIDEKLMSPKKGSPVLVRLNRFSGWSADITISYLDNVYSEEQILNIINLAGFGIGIGSGRSSGFGRYHITGVKAI